MMTAALAALVLASPPGCAPRDRASADSPRAADTSVRPAVTPPLVGQDLRALRWIEGTWRGTGETQPAFYERYSLADDSTLVVESFADSTMARVTDSTRFELRGGALTSVPQAPGARWYGSALSGDSVRFEPLSGARNAFVWKRGSGADDWVAVLSWPAASGGRVREVTYTMRRWK